MKKILTITLVNLVIAILLAASCGRGGGRGRRDEPSFRRDRAGNHNPGYRGGIDGQNPPTTPTPTPTPGPTPTPTNSNKFMIKKSDLPSCEIGRVQVWAQKNSAGSNSLMKRSLAGVWGENELKITKDYNSYIFSLPVHLNSIGDAKIVRLHATLYCYEDDSTWGDASNAQSYDWQTGDDNFAKSPFTLVQLFGKVYHHGVESLPPELAPGHGQDRLVIGVSSSIPLYSDYSNNSPESVKIVGRYYGRYTDSSGYKEGCISDQNRQYYQNLEPPLFHFRYNGYNGYIDAAGKLTGGEDRFDTDVRYIIACVKLFNGKKACSDVIFNQDYTGGASHPAKFEWGMRNFPSWM